MHFFPVKAFQMEQQLAEILKITFAARRRTRIRIDVSVITLQSQAPSFFFLFSLYNLQVFFLFITGLGEIHFSQSFLKEMS